MITQATDVTCGQATLIAGNRMVLPRPEGDAPCLGGFALVLLDPTPPPMEGSIKRQILRAIHYLSRLRLTALCSINSVASCTLHSYIFLS